VDKNWKGYLVSGVLGLLVLLTVVLGVWERSELGFYDTWFNLRGREDPGKDIVVVAEDEKSMSELGPLPWPLSLHARLLEQIRQAKVVGFDLLFDAPKDEASDAAFAGAVAGHGGVILASMFAF
jgi:adenylate cyclase